jgi:metallo-beta-lactamase class B
MRTSQLIFVALWSVVAAAQGPSTLRPDPPITCDSCAEWNAKREPFRIFGNTYYVGPAGLSAILIASNSGLILLDGALPQSAAPIDESIRALGFRTSDIRLIVNSHGHFDHAGGIAALQRASGAVVAASASSARALERGQPVDDDPQFGFGPRENGFPPVKTVRVIADGETLRVGDQAITAHFTPGHTPGSTTWTWRSCEGSRCLDIVYADSLTAVSAPGFRFTGDATHPGIVEAFRRSIATVERLPCDVLLTVHPGFADLDKKLERRRQDSSTNPFISAQECRAYAANAAKTLERRIAEEKGTKR